MKLYVANLNGNSITVYDAAATGNAAPIATIAGANTGLNAPASVAVDATGRIYVANAGANSITAYGAGGTGNVSPTATIAGDLTGLVTPFGLAVDAAGRIYVANRGANSITVYAAGATGNAAPIATIAGDATGLDVPLGVALDGRAQQHGGQHLYVANNGLSASITVYPISATGNAAPTATITGLTYPAGVAVDTAVALLYVGSNGANSITVYDAGATGNATPTATLTGDRTGLNLPVGVALDAVGKLYVANPGLPNSPGNSITVYPARATGNLPPTATISGTQTGLNGPAGLAVGP